MSETQGTRVQRYPRGYLGHLGAQTSGTTPPDASEIIAPTVDIGPFLEFGSIKTAVVGMTPSTVGFQTIAGPGSATAWANDQAWMVLAWGVRSNAVLAAGTTIRAALGMQCNNGQANFPIDDTDSFTVGEIGMWGIHLPRRPVFLGFNEQVGLWIANYVGGAGTACTGFVRYVTVETQ